MVGSRERNSHRTQLFCGSVLMIRVILMIGWLEFSILKIIRNCWRALKSGIVRLLTVIFMKTKFVKYDEDNRILATALMIDSFARDIKPNGSLMSLNCAHGLIWRWSVYTAKIAKDFVRHRLEVILKYNPVNETLLLSVCACIIDCIRWINSFLSRFLAITIRTVTKLLTFQSESGSFLSLIESPLSMDLRHWKNILATLLQAKSARKSFGTWR